MKKLVFSFGRFNPPTTGHEVLLKKVVAVAKKENADAMVYSSQSNDPKKNPLPYKEKTIFMKAMFPKHKKVIQYDVGVKNAFDTLSTVYAKGYRDVTMVVGSDRVTEFEKILNKYNDVEGRHGYYNFESGVKVVSAGARDPDAEGVTGMSASKMRAAAAANDFESFEKGMPAGFKGGQSVFDAVRKGMNLSEEMMEFMESDIEGLREFFETDLVNSLGVINDVELFESLMESVQNGLIGLDQIKKFESVVDKLFAKYDIDFNFTRHFGDRMDDSRNNPSITLKELAEFIKKMYKRQGKSIKGVAGAEAVLKDIQSNLNIPVAVTYDRNNDEFDVVLKTIMRKKNFTSPDKVIKYEENDMTNQLPEGFMDAILGKNMKKRDSGNAEQTKIATDINRKLKVIDGLMKEVKPLGGKITRMTSFRKTPIQKMTPKDLYRALNDWYLSIDDYLNDNPAVDKRHGPTVVKLYSVWEEVADKIQDYMWASGYNVERGKRGKRGAPNKMGNIIADVIKPGGPVMVQTKKLKVDGKLVDIDYNVPKRTDAKWLKMNESVELDEMKEGDLPVWLSVYLDHKIMAIHTTEKAGRKYMVGGDGPDGHFLVKTTRKALGKRRVGQFVPRSIGKHLDNGPYPHDDGPLYSIHKESVARKKLLKVVDKAGGRNQSDRLKDAAKAKSDREKSDADLAAFRKKHGMAENYLDELKIDMPKKGAGLGITRDKMPQVDEKDYPEYFAYLKEKGITLKKGKEDPNKLKPIQKEFAKIGVEKSLDKMLAKKDNAKFIIVSKDDYIVDGHHRWLAAKNGRQQLNVMRANVNMKELLKATNEFPKTTFKSIKNVVKNMQEVRQDSDVKDKKGTQPSKYYAADADGDKMSKSTKEKRAAYFAKGGSKKSAPGDKGAKTKESEHTKKYRQMFGETKPCWDGYTQQGMKKKGGKMVPNCVPEETVNEEKIDGLVKKSEKSGISYGILKKVYDRGMAAWKSGHRPGTTAQQWAFARVNSFVTKGKGTWGKADKDLAAKVRSESFLPFSVDEDRDYKKERENYLGTPKQMERNAARSRARRLAIKKGIAERGDGRDIHHKDNNPLNNDPKNLSSVTQKYNRTEPRKRK